jgi:uncharacterized membrane protein
MYINISRKNIRTNTKNLRVTAASDTNFGRKNRFPTKYERIVSAALYIFPALDATAVTLSFFKWWVSLSWAWFLLEPITTLYYSSSFTPLIVFFIMFLAFVRNKNFHHIVRFHAMQAVMIDMIIMIASCIRSHLPPEFRWSVMIVVLDRFIGATIFISTVFCVWHALQGHYADIAYISNAVYIQVDMLESYGA